MRSQAAVMAPVRRPTLPDRHRGVAVQGEGAAGAVEHAGGDHLGRAAGHGLLGGLEDAAHPAGQAADRGQRQGHAER